MDLELWGGMALLVLFLMLLAGLAGLQIPLARKSRFWLGLCQPAIWAALAVLGKIREATGDPELAYGSGAILMAVLTLALYFIGRFVPKKREDKAPYRS